MLYIKDLYDYFLKVFLVQTFYFSVFFLLNNDLLLYSKRFSMKSESKGNNKRNDASENDIT